MPFNTKFTPSQYQDRDQYNENVLNERYVTVKALRESYSHIYQELANLRNNLQDYKSEQDNQPELATAESDRIRYNNEIENRYLALKSIQLNTSYPNEYGHTIRPFSENKASEQLRLHCNYIISGSHHFKQYHLAKTSCLELNQDTSGETIKEYNSNVVNMKTGNLQVTGVSWTSSNAIKITSADNAKKTVTSIAQGANALFTTAAAHNLVVGDKIRVTATSNTNNLAQIFNNEFFIVSTPSVTTFTISTTRGGTALDTSAGANMSGTANLNTCVVAQIDHITSAGVFRSIAHGLNSGDVIWFSEAANLDLDGANSSDITEYKNKSFFIHSVPNVDTFTVSSELGGVAVTTSGVEAVAVSDMQIFTIFKKGSTETVTITCSNTHSLAVGNKVNVSGFKAVNGYDIFNGEEVTVIALNATNRTFNFTFDIFGFYETAWVLATHAGEVHIGYEVKFPYKKMYLNKLDAINSAAVYGDDSDSRTFTYSDNYIESGLDTNEGHIYMITKGAFGSNAELDGRQTASVLGRNVQNLENMIEIVANNCNACEQSMNRIVQIAELTGVEINHN